MYFAICDDDTYDLSCIVSLLEIYNREHDHMITYETFSSALELLEAIRHKSFDLLFLDIVMPGMNGIDTAREIRQTDAELPIIFLTSSREFAVESYRVQAKDYLVKPVKREELFPILDRQLENFSKTEQFILLKTKDGLIKLPVSKIVYIEVLNRIIQITLANGTALTVYGYLSEYEERLLGNPAFFKPHRSYLVNLAQVTGIDKKGFLTATGHTVPVARDTYAKAKAAYLKYLMDDFSGGGSMRPL